MSLFNLTCQSHSLKEKEMRITRELLSLNLTDCLSSNIELGEENISDLGLKLLEGISSTKSFNSFSNQSHWFSPRKSPVSHSDFGDLLNLVSRSTTLIFRFFKLKENEAYTPSKGVLEFTLLLRKYLLNNL